MDNKGSVKQNPYRENLVSKMDAYVHFIYKISRKFPKDELYGSTSQIRRSSLSIVLNYIEGYARIKSAVQLNFFETSYGSLKESKYLVRFAHDEGWISEEEFTQGGELVDEVGAMLWTELKNLRKAIKGKD